MQETAQLIPQILQEISLLKQIAEDPDSFTTSEVSDAVTSYYELIDHTIEKNSTEDLLPAVELLEPFSDDSREYYIEAQNRMENNIASDLISSGAHIVDYWHNTYKDSYNTYGVIESASIRNSIGTPKHIFLVGSGALPLTAFALRKHFPETDITTIDKDLEATAISKDILELLENTEREITVLPALPAEKISNFDNYDMIMILASVGQSNEEKINILRTISSKVKSGTHILIRHASENSLGTLIFSPFILNTDINEYYSLVSSYGYNQAEVLTHTIIKRI